MKLNSFPASRNQNPTRRAGFTLIELLISISIIALLIGLLLPALSSMRGTARIAEVKKEIDDLGAALEAFKTTFGSYPPSRITLYGDKLGWDSDKRSKAIIHALWPKFNFNTDGANGDFTSPGKPVTLDGAECLLFFLGGVRQKDPMTGAAEQYIGFSNNPAQPFSTEPIDSRDGPFLEVDMSRVTVDADGDDYPVYLDTLPDQTQPYIYLSGYNGQGYSDLDLDADPDPMVTTLRMTTYYKQTGSTGWNAKSFQIISAGQDHDYGAGGLYDPKTAGSSLAGADRDNITNFSPGMLAK